MAEARNQERWMHTASLMALIANAHRDPKKRAAFTPADFHPLERNRKKHTVLRGQDLSILKSVFVDPQKATRPGEKEPSDERKQ